MSGMQRDCEAKKAGNNIRGTMVGPLDLILAAEKV